MAAAAERQVAGVAVEGEVAKKAAVAAGTAAADNAVAEKAMAANVGEEKAVVTAGRSLGR